MDCLTEELMKLSKTDQKLIKYLNLVMYFLPKIENELLLLVLSMPRPHPYCPMCLGERHAPSDVEPHLKE